MKGRSTLRIAVAALGGLALALDAPLVSEAAARPRGDTVQAPQGERRAARPRATATVRPVAARAANSGRPARPRATARTVEPPEPLPRISAEVFDAVQTAAGPQQGTRALMLALAWRESRFDPRADNPASSARGLMQFTRDTWLEVVRDHGATHGLTRYAADIAVDRATGRHHVRDDGRLEEILSLRDDPRLSAMLTMARLRDEKDRLRRSLGRPVAEADLYLVHFLGPDGASRFLRQLARTPSHRASDYISREAVAANRSVFITSNGRHRSLREVYATVQGTVTAQGRVYTRLAASIQDPDTPVEVASAR